MELGTVGWELTRCQVWAQWLREDEAVQRRAAELDETEPTPIRRIWDAIARLFHTR